MVTNDELIRLCEAIHVKNKRDKDNTSVLIFKTILSISDGPISCSVVSYLTGVHRLTVRHHLEKMKRIGLLKEENRKYVMRFKTIKEYIHYRKRIMLAMFKELEKIAEELDHDLELFESNFMLGELHAKRKRRH